MCNTGIHGLRKEGGRQVARGRAERAIAGVVERHVAVDAPLARDFYASVPCSLRQCWLEIREAADVAIGVADPHLVQVDVIVERRQLRRRDRWIHRRQGGADLYLADVDAGGDRLAQRIGRRLELHGRVAGIEAQADTAANDRFRLWFGDTQLTANHGQRGGGHVLLHERDHFLRGLDQAVRLGFQSQADLAATLPRQPFQCHGHLAQRGGHDRAVAVIGDGGAVGTGDGTDAARHAFGQEVRQDIGEHERIVHALARPPVGLVDRLLDAGTVERPVGEAVDREGIKIVCR